MTVPIPKPEAPSAADTVIGALASLVASQGWAIVVKILNDNIAYLEKAILDQVDPITKEPLTDAEADKLRTKRDLNTEVRDTPQNYSKVVKDTGEVPEDFDPYYKTKKEIDKDQQR